MTAFVSIYALTWNKLVVVIVIWKVTVTTVPIGIGPIDEIVNEVAAYL